MPVVQGGPMNANQIAATLASLSDWNDSAPKLRAVATASPPVITLTLSVQLPNPLAGAAGQAATYESQHTVTVRSGDPEYAAILAAVQAAAARIVSAKQVAVNATLATAQTALNGGAAVATPVTVA